MNNQTGILIFSHSPHRGAQSKQLSACKEKNFQLWQQLYNNTLRAAGNTGLPIIICTEDLQVGNTFPEKLTHAVEQAFKSGLEKLIIVGTDCPGIRTNNFIIAATQLNLNQQIISGPDLRGGVYLIGLHKDAYDRKSFLSLRWQTAHLLADLDNYARRFNHAQCEATLTDIHCHTDLILSLNTSSLPAAWRQMVSRLLFYKKTFYLSLFSSIKCCLPINQFSLRAPPAVSFL